MSALLQAGLAAGKSLISGLLGSRAASKAANQEFRYQDALNDNAFRQQRSLQDEQNRVLNETNDRVGIWNREILDNHSWDYHESDVSSSGGIDFGKFVRDAEANGINPLAAMRNGALAGYATTNTRTVSADKRARELMSFFGPGEIPAGPSAGHAPTVQASNPWGDALTSGFNAWSSFDAHADDKAFLERELARAQIRNLDSDTTANNRRFFVPSYTDTGVRHLVGGINGAARTANGTSSAALGAVAKPTVGEVKVTNPLPLGNVTSWLRDAAASEERWGEIISNVAGAINLGIDGLGLVHQGAKAADRAITGGRAQGVGEVARGYFHSAVEAMRNAWASPAWNAK